MKDLVELIGIVIDLIFSVESTGILIRHIIVKSLANISNLDKQKLLEYYWNNINSFSLFFLLMQPEHFSQQIYCI